MQSLAPISYDVLLFCIEYVVNGSLTALIGRNIFNCILKKKTRVITQHLRKRSFQVSSAVQHPSHNCWICCSCNYCTSPLCMPRALTFLYCHCLSLFFFFFFCSAKKKYIYTINGIIWDICRTSTITLSKSFRQGDRIPSIGTIIGYNQKICKCSLLSAAVPLVFLSPRELSCQLSGWSTGVIAESLVYLTCH